MRGSFKSGRGGRRAGGGFYDWLAEGPRTPWPGLAAIFPLAAGQPDLETLKLRLLVAEAREALRCLEEGAIASADDADTASVLGLGFPEAQRLLVLRWAEDFGLKPFVAACDSLAVGHGVRFAPTSWLRELASQGEGLKAYRRERSAA